MIYELREYTTHENTAQRVHDRFADKALPLFARHGLEVVGFWIDGQNPNQILYLLRFEDVSAQKLAWAGFRDDADWQEAKAASESAGPIVAHMASRTLLPVPYWPTAPKTNDERRPVA